MTFFAEYNPPRCGKEKESTQHSAKTVHRKGPEDRKESKGKLKDNFVSSTIRALNTPQRRSLATFAPFAVQFLC
jgi:hypothetical protein